MGNASYVDECRSHTIKTARLLFKMAGQCRTKMWYSYDMEQVLCGPWFFLPLKP